MKRNHAKLASLVGLAVLALAEHSAHAVVVLHPGTIAGTAGLSGATFSYGSVNVSNGSFSGSANVTNDAFSLTTESNQTYDSVTAYEYDYTPNYHQFQLNTWGAGINLPLNGSVTANLQRPGGTLAIDIGVSSTTITNPSSGQATVTPQGSVASAQFYAYAYNYDASEAYNATAQGSSGNFVMPMAASDSITVWGSATINVFDDTGTKVLCTTDVQFPQQVVSLTAGATLDVSNFAAVDPSMCSAAVMKGSVGLHNAPGGIIPQYGYVYSGGPPYNWQWLDGFSASTPDRPYEFDGLTKTNYYPSAYVYFPYPLSSDYLSLPNQNPQYVDLNAGGTVQRDFLFDGAVATGNVAISGPAASYMYYGQKYFYGNWDWTQPSYGPTAGGYAGASIDAQTGNYTAILTPGTWQESQTFYGFTETIQDVYYYDYLYQSTQATVNAVAGQTISVPQESLSVSEGIIVFDVLEPPGTSAIGISNPQVNAYAYDYNAGTYTQAQAYAYVTNADSPSVHLIAPAGNYTFDAYATVQGTYTKFASSTISIGNAVNTPVGPNVTIVPQDAAGNPTPITLSFGNVSQGGQTTASFTDVGPSAPQDYSLLQVINNDQYLNITSSAQFTQSEVCIKYDPATLGITAAQESTLALQEFTCSTSTSCAWQVVNGVLSGHNGGTAVNTSTHTICGLVDQLGTFGITLPNVVLTPPTDTCVGSQSAPAQLSTDPGVCTTTVNNVNQLAGGCSGGGGGLASCTFDAMASEALSLGGHDVSILGTAVDGSTASCDSFVSVADREIPSLACPASKTVECTGVNTQVSGSATCGDNCGACSVSCGSGSYALGNTVIGCNAVDTAGNHGSCSTNVKVVDTKAPSLKVTASPSVVWPPYHQLVAITLAKTTSDVCDPNPTVTCSATSNEPDKGINSVDVANDIQWVNGALYLRAERADAGTGRIYTITCKATDASGNSSSATTTVTIPKTQPASTK